MEKIDEDNNCSYSEELKRIMSYSNSELIQYLGSNLNVTEFCQCLFKSFLTSPSGSSIRVIFYSLLIHSNFDLREEILSYFELPIFVQLSENRLNNEIEACQDERLKQAVFNISSTIKNDKDSLLQLKSKSLPKIVEFLFNTDNDHDTVELGIKLIILLLLQPSCRRFVRPFLEDTLFISVIEMKCSNINLLQELNNVFFYPIDEMSGVYFNSHEEYVSSHFLKIRALQSKSLNYSKIFILSNIPSSSFSSLEKLYQSLLSLSYESLTEILTLMGCSGYSRDLPKKVLLNSIVSSLGLRQPLKFESIVTFPTEANLNSNSVLRPLTLENLSKQDLFERHLRLIQANLFNDLSEHVSYNIKACQPILNSDNKTEFPSWTRDAMEVVSSAIVKTSCPDVQKNGKYQKIELEVSIHTPPLDQMTLKSWMELKASDVVFVCRVEAQKDGEFVLKNLRSVLIDSKTSTKNTLTLKLLVDPDQFDLESRTEIYSKFNFIIKRSSSETNDVRILRSISSQMHQSLPELVEDTMLGISHPDQVPEYSSFNDSDPIVNTCLNSGLSICEGPFGSGCTTVLNSVTKRLHEQNKKTVILFRSGQAVDDFYKIIIGSGIPEHEIVRLGFSSTIGNIQQKFNIHIKQVIENINSHILSAIGANSIYTCGEADYVMRSIIQPRWQAFSILLESDTMDYESLLNMYPFAKCLSIGDNQIFFRTHFENICSIFNVAKQLAPLELLQSSAKVSKYVLGNLSKIVLMTSKYAAINAKDLSDNGLNFESLFVDDCNLIPEIEVLLSLTAQSNPSNLRRLGLFGHLSGGRPQCFNESLREAGANMTIMDRFIFSGFSKTIHLTGDSEHRPLWYKSAAPASSKVFKNSIQFVNVEAVLGKGEEMPMRNYIQNLDEAEYAVASFELLRLKGIAASQIAILSAYKGQVELINEVIQTRCAWTDFYSKPAFVGTIDQSNGLHFDYVIISLVRTKAVGFLSDSTRLELALTRAREGLIILGYRDLFASKGSFFESLVSQSSDKLILNDGTEFDNVETITKYVYDLSVEQLQ